MIPPKVWFGLLILPLFSSPFAQAQSGEQELQRLLQENRYEEAVPLLARKVQSNPQDDTSRLRLGQILNFLGQPERAIAVWEDGLKGDDPVADPNFWRVIGDRYRQMAEDGPKVLRVGGAVTYQPNQSRRLNEQEWRQDRWGQAIQAYYNLVESCRVESEADPDDDNKNAAYVGATVRLADAFQASGNLDKAEQWWNHVIYLDPSHQLASERVNGMEKLRQDVQQAARVMVDGGEPAARNTPLYNLAATEAIEMLEEYVQKNPQDNAKRARLGQLLAYQGQAERALEVWQTGVNDGVGDDSDLWLQIGDFYREDAETTEALVKAAREGRAQQTGNAEDEALEMAEESLRAQDNWQSAMDAYAKVVSAQPENLDAAIRYAYALEGVGNLEVAQQWWGHVFQTDPTNTMAALRYAALQMHNKDLIAAGTTLMAGLDSNPRSAPLWAFAAQLSSEMGDTAKAEEAANKARFFGWLPPFCKDVPYSEQASQLIQALRESNELESAVDELISSPGPESSQLIAAICWHRKVEGPVVERCFDELVKRKEDELLLQLFQTAGSTHTLRYTGEALAELKHPQAFDLLMELLQQDNKPIWHLDAANSLAILGDPRAIDPLIRVLSPEVLSTPDYLSDEDSSVATDGPLFARHRAALALGKFNDPKAKAALRKGLTNPDIAIACNAALYRQTNEQMHLRAIEPIQGEMRDLLMDYIAEINRPEAQQLHQRWEEFKDAEYKAARDLQIQALEARKDRMEAEQQRNANP